MELKNSQIHPSPKGKGLLWQEDKLFDWNKDNENLLNDANIILENIKVLVDSDGKIYEKKV